MSNFKQSVSKFSEAMLAKLEANKHKKGWLDVPEYDDDWFYRRIGEEVMELIQAAQSGDVEATLLEAADVANFALMIAERTEYYTKRTTPE